MSSKINVRNQTNIFFKLAGVISILYFALRILAPIFLYLYYLIFMLAGKENVWYANSGPLTAIGGSSNFGIASPLLVLILLLVALGINQASKQKLWMEMPAHRLVLLATLADTIALLLTSILFTFFSFPNLTTGNSLLFPDSWSTPLMVFFAIITIVSLIFYIALTNIAVKNNMLTSRFRLTFLLGLLALNAVWFTLNPQFDVLGPLSTVIFILGIGWGIGLWKLGDPAQG